MSRTSTEVKQRWIDNNYKRIVVNLRYDTDKELIDYIEQRKEQFGTTEIFRLALEKLIESGELG